MHKNKISALLFFSLLISFGTFTIADESPTKPEAIHGENIPKIPADLWKKQRRYQDIIGAGFRDWSPDGKSILIGTRHGNLTQLHAVSRPGAKPKLLTKSNEPTTSGFFLPDGRIIFRRAHGGNEHYQVFVLDPKTDKEELLTDGKSRHLLSKPHPDGKRIVFTSTRRNGRDADIYLQEAKVGAPAKTIYTVGPGELWFLADWTTDGKKAIIARYVSRNESYAKILDLETLKTTGIPSEKDSSREMGREKIYRSGYQFGPDGNTVYFLSDAKGEFRELAQVNLTTKKTQWISQGINWDVESLQFTEDRKTAVFSVNVDGYSSLYKVDIQAIEVQKEKSSNLLPFKKIPLPPSLIASLNFSQDGKRLGLSLGRPTSPAEAYELDLATNKLTRWTFSERAGFNEDDFVNPDLFRYTTFDKREVAAFLFRPHGPKEKLPVIITIHGGPESQYRPWFSATRQMYVNELGIAVIAPNVRGSTGYGKTFSLLDNGMKREDSVKDIGELLNWIATTGKERFNLDPTRVAVSGGSYGGYMVLASLIHFGDKLKAGVDNVGISDFITFLENTSAYRRDLRRAEYGDERIPEMRAHFKKISPLRQMHKLRSALFLCHGENDPRVPYSEALQIVEKAKATGQPVWTFFAKNEGHGFRRKENADYQLAVKTLFFKEFLLGPKKETSSNSTNSSKKIAQVIQTRNQAINKASLQGELKKPKVPAILKFDKLTPVDHIVIESENGQPDGTPFLIEVSFSADFWQAIYEGRTGKTKSIHSFQPVSISGIRIRFQQSEKPIKINKIEAHNLLNSEQIQSYQDYLHRYRSQDASPSLAELLDKWVQEVPYFGDARRLRGRVFEDLREHQKALDDYDCSVALEPGRGVDQLFRGNVLFKLEKFKESVAAYDIYTKGNKRRSASCWQRGLAWYYLGLFKEGKEQFEGYHSVDDLDIENGIWRYLCIAEAKDLDEAKKTFLPYPTKVRPPFPTLHKLYAGNGEPEEVIKEAKDRASSKESLNRNLFYGHYYIAKYYEVIREFEKANKEIDIALKHKIPHFMWDCAKIDKGRIVKRLK